MIEYRDLLALAMWCQSQGFSWLPGRSEQGCEALVLEKPGHRTESLLLLHDSHGYCLIDPLGELLVSASDLTVLLDALDGGIADSTRSVMADSAARRKPRLRAA